MRKFSRSPSLRAAVHSRDARRGAVLVVALVCLVVAMALLGGLLQGTLRARRQMHSERDRRQTEMLLQAGLDRAAFRLANEADYRGETWQLAPEEIVGTGAGQVTIEAAPPAEREPWQLKITAEYPYGNLHSIRRSRTFLIQPPAPLRQE